MSVSPKESNASIYTQYLEYLFQCYIALLILDYILELLSKLSPRAAIISSVLCTPFSINLFKVPLFTHCAIFVSNEIQIIVTHDDWRTTRTLFAISSHINTGEVLEMIDKFQSTTTTVSSWELIAHYNHCSTARYVFRTIILDLRLVLRFTCSIEVASLGLSHNIWNQC